MNTTGIKQTLIKKINAKIIVLEILAVFFLINGIQRLYLASQGEKFNAIMNSDMEKYYSLTSTYASVFLERRGYWSLGGFMIGILLIGIINWKIKIHFINSMVTFLIIFMLLPSGLFMKGLINNSLNNFCAHFGVSYSFSYLIGSLILIIIGVLILWKILIMKKDKNHTTANPLTDSLF